MNKNVRLYTCTLGVAGLLGFATGPVLAAGFQIQEQSVSGLGNAYAGGAAIAEDAATVFYNPAGMTRLGNSQMAGALHYIRPSLKFKDSNSRLTPALGGGSYPGGDGGDAGVPAVVPNVYYVQQLPANMAFGLGINAPFGLSTKYDSNWVGRYHGIESGIKTININPALAWKSGGFSIGGGVSAQYLEAKLTNAIDFSAVCLGSPAAAACGGLGLNTPGQPATDGGADIEGTSWAFGFNLGALWEITPTTRVGAAYRSQYKHKVKGDAKFDNSVATGLIGLLGGNIFTDTDANLDLTLPAVFSVSGYHEFGAFAIMADASWTQWSTMGTLTVEFDNATPDKPIEFDWYDTWRYSVGANYRVSPAVLLRTGVAYDQAPVDKKEKRLVSIPDNDRVWFSLGAGFKVARGVTVDVAYTRLFIDNAKILNTDATGHILEGEYSSSTDLLSAQVAWSF